MPQLVDYSIKESWTYFWMNLISPVTSIILNHLDKKKNHFKNNLPCLWHSNVTAQGTIIYFFHILQHTPSNGCRLPHWPLPKTFYRLRKILSIKLKMALRTFTYSIFNGPEAEPGRPSIYQA